MSITQTDSSRAPKLAATSFQLLFDNSPTAMLLEDADGYLTDANPAACALFDTTRTGLLGKHASEVVPPRMTSAPAGSDVRESVLQTAGGESREVSVLNTPLHFGPDEEYLVSIWERFPDDEPSDMAGGDQETLQRASRQIAHILNDHLTAIQGFVSLARNDVESGRIRNEHLIQIAEAADHGAKLARGLLSFGQLEVSPSTEITPGALLAELGADVSSPSGDHEPAEDASAAAPELDEIAEPIAEPEEAHVSDDVGVDAPTLADEDVSAPSPEEADTAPSEPKEEAAATPAPKKRTAPHGGNETILVVEDEDMVRDLVKRSLGYLGYNVIDACNGEEGLAVGRERHEEIDMVFTDIVMPRMSGPEMVAKMGEENLEMPVLYTTGFTDNKRLLDNGEIREGVNLLPKPYTTKVLAGRIREVLDTLDA